MRSQHCLLQENNRQEGSGLKPTNYTPLPTRNLALDATPPKAMGKGRGRQGSQPGAAEAREAEGEGRGGPRRDGRGLHVGRRSGAGRRRLPGSPHLLRRALLQHILLHGHGPRGAGGDTGGGVRLLAPPPALAARFCRAPGNGADRRGGQRPRQPGAKAMAAGERGHRGLAARRGQRGPQRRPRDFARPASARLVRRGRGHGRAAEAGAREGASKLGRVTRARSFSGGSRATAGKGEGTEGAAGWNGAVLLPPQFLLPSPNRRHLPRPATPPPPSPARRPP